ncbi:MAG: HNH endonuclease [Deltaproteobacteria bacterium]|nr:HNH endonuclease [Deltaproteobacteria bacterium]
MPFQIDQVIAEKHGGLTTEDNLGLSCEHCNSHSPPTGTGARLRCSLCSSYAPRPCRWPTQFRLSKICRPVPARRRRRWQTPMQRPSYR